MELAGVSIHAMEGDGSLSAGRTAPKLSTDAGRERILELAVDLLGGLLRAPSDGINAAIDQALEQLGRFCGVDRAYVFRLTSDAVCEKIDNTHEWCAENTAPTIHLNRDLPGNIIGPWRPGLSANMPIIIEDVAALPDTSPEKTLLLSQGIRSLLAVPMRAGGQLSGFVGFDTVRRRREFSPAEVQLLKSVADAIGAALTRADTTAEIAAAQASMAEAHDRLKTTLAALPELVLEVDAKGRYLGVHTSDPGQMMVPPEHLIGKTDAEVMPPEIAALNRRAMAEVDATGRSGPHPFWADTPRGRRRYAVSVSPRPPHRSGDAPGYVFVSRDITEEWRLAREAERLGLIARRMTDLVMVIGLDDHIEWVNPAFEARTGWRLEEVRGQRPDDLLHAPGTDKGEVARLSAAMEAGEAVRGQLLNRTRDGEEFWTEIDIQPLHDADGTLTGFVSIETDITERKAQAAALERLAREATEARDRLTTAVEALPDAFAFWDAEDRLVLCNRRHQELYPGVARMMVPGVQFETLLRAAIASGDIVATDGDVEALLRARMAAHHTPGNAVERQLSNGSWQRVIDFATADGGRVAMAIDITELKMAEQRLADIITGAEAGTWEWTVPDGTNTINARWAEIVGYTLAELAPVTIDVWRRLVHPDDLAAADIELDRVFEGATDQFEYVLRMRHKEGHWVWVQSRGRVTRRTAEGKPDLMAGVHLDITALKGAEERLEEIINAAAAGTWELDLVSGVKRVNERWAEMLGYTRAELAKRPHHGFRELIHPDDMAVLDAQHDTLKARGNDRFANEIRMRHKTGHWVWILSRGRVVSRDASGKPLKVAGIHLDITERMRLEAQLTAERDYLSRLMETSASGITALDGSGRIIFANREAERILGLSPLRLDGMTYDAPEWQITALDGSPLDSSDLPYTRVMAEGKTVRDVRHAIAWPDGTQRILSINAAPIKAEGLAVRVVCSIADITEQVAAEDALRNAADRAEAANRAKSRFLANMSHEIRTPLNGILGMAQLLEGDLSDPQHREMLKTIRASGEMLLGVLNDVLDMSKIEAGKLSLEQTPFLPEDLMGQVEAMHRLRAAEKGLSFDISIAPEARTARLGDPARLAQVLHNLVGNAIKFTESGSVTLALACAEDGALTFSVRDTGIGMSEEQLARVFEDFEQADGTVTRRFGGTGLGMSIVRRLVTLMQGEIAVESTEGIGTEVQVRLPLPLAEAVQEAPRAAPVGAMSGLRVLAADDNLTNRTVLGSMLARLGVDVVSVADGRDALDAWEAGRFDLYLLDISMPELDGISTLSCLRQREADTGQPPAPALAITANVMSHQVAEYHKAGFAGYLGKPFRREDLAAALSMALKENC